QATDEIGAVHRRRALPEHAPADAAGALQVAAAVDLEAHFRALAVPTLADAGGLYLDIEGLIVIEQASFDAAVEDAGPGIRRPQAESEALVGLQGRIGDQLQDDLHALGTRQEGQGTLGQQSADEV